jgi:hypothetical protein
MQPKQNNSNFLLFATLSLGVMLLCMWLSEVFWPRPKPDPVNRPAAYVAPKPDAPRAVTALVGPPTTLAASARPPPRSPSPRAGPTMAGSCAA